jgi:hypothetical protein
MVCQYFWLVNLIGRNMPRKEVNAESACIDRALWRYRAWGQQASRRLLVSRDLASFRQNPREPLIYT